MMQTIKKVIIGTLFTFILAIGFSTPDAKAAGACTDPVGTYVLDTYYSSTSTQDFAGKRVITLTQDGQFFSIDSNEGGTFGVPPAAQSFPNNRFTSGQGIWQCIKLTPASGTRDIIAKVFNFNFPDPNGSPYAKVTIATANYSIYQDGGNLVHGDFQISTQALEGAGSGGSTYRFFFKGKKLDFE